MTRWICPSCGMVRSADERPWCRHGDVALPAARMNPLKPSHPLFAEEPAEWEFGR